MEERESSFSRNLFLLTLLLSTSSQKKKKRARVDDWGVEFLPFSLSLSLFLVYIRCTLYIHVRQAKIIRCAAKVVSNETGRLLSSARFR